MRVIIKGKRPDKLLKKRIHINQHNIKFNQKNGEPIKSVITVKCSKGNFYGHSVTVRGYSEIVYRMNKPLSCGAKVWIETQEIVEIWDKEGELIYVIR